MNNRELRTRGLREKPHEKHFESGSTVNIKPALS